MPRRWTRIVMAFMTALALVPLGTQPPLEAQAPTDARQRIVLPAPARDKILAEMRAMLQSLSGVLHALAANDLAGAEQAARASGMGTAADVQPEIRMQLPPAFLQLGMQTHRGFDALADQLKGGGARETVLKSLASLTSNCVGCHAAYRLDEAR
jgi:hypothetical protein